MKQLSNIEIKARGYIYAADGGFVFLDRKDRQIEIFNDIDSAVKFAINNIGLIDKA